MIDVDTLQRELSVRDLARYYGVALPERFGDEGEQRLACPCRDCGGNGDERSVSVNLSDPFKRWKCHRENYGCGAQGNLVTLAYCFNHGTMPTGGKRLTDRSPSLQIQRRRLPRPRRSLIRGLLHC